MPTMYDNPFCFLADPDTSTLTSSWSGEKYVSDSCKRKVASIVKKNEVEVHLDIYLKRTVDE